MDIRPKRFRENKVYIQNVGKIRIKLHREIEGQIKSVSIKKEVGHWYASFLCLLPNIPIKENNSNPEIGIDVGLESFYTDSEGYQEPNPRFHKKALKNIQIRKIKSHFGLEAYHNPHLIYSDFELQFHPKYEQRKKKLEKVRQFE